MFVNNATCLQQQQQPVAIYYNRYHSTIALENVGGATRGFVCTCMYIRVLVTSIFMT